MRKLTSDETKFLKSLLEKNPTKEDGYFRYRIRIDGRYRSFKRSRIVFQLHLGKYLERWELVRHKDGNRGNDAIKNLEVLNTSDFARISFSGSITKPKGWKPANTTTKENIKRIHEIASTMIKINCCEIERRLAKEKIKISNFTIKKYLPKQEDL